MKRVSLSLSIVFTALAVFAGPVLARADLAGQIQAVLLDKLLTKADVGIEVVKLGATAADNTVIFKHDSEIPLIPASNLKLVTTSAALDALGSDFKFRTLLVKHGEDIILVGDGDPTLGDGELLKKSGWDATTLFKNWADGLNKKGIKQVGNVLVDDSVFDEVGVHKNWPTDHDQLSRHYSAEVGGVNLGANCVDFYPITSAEGTVVSYRTEPPTEYLSVRNACITGGANAVNLTREAGSNNVTLSGTCPESLRTPVQVTVHDPALFAATVLAETLKGAGITVTGKVARDRSVRASLSTVASAQGSGWKLLAVYETPLSQAMARANKDSVNLYAECLCKRLGFKTSGQSGSWENGTAANAAFLKKAGVPESEFKLDDGCGLSKQNAISANALVHVLMYDFYGKNREAFMSSLAIAGSDGTLATRFPGSDLRGRVFGKSGFVKGVSTLSGFLQAKDGNWYAFSILFNGIPELSNSAVKTLHEAIVKAVDSNSIK